MVEIPPEIIEQAQRAIEAVKKYGRVERAYLFGSYAWGTPHEYSDIDVAVFTEGAESWSFDHKITVVVKAQQEAGDNIELHVFPASVLPHPETASFAEHIVENGILIEEKPEAVPHR